MTLTLTDYQAWLDALIKASHELVPTTFGFEECSQAEHGKLVQTGNCVGAFVPLVTHEGTIQVGVMSTPDGCLRLARAFLGFEPDEAVSEEDTSDAFREIANILAGMCKSSMKSRVAVTNLGLPIIIKGCEQMILENKVRIQSMIWGEIDCAVAILENQSV